MKTNLDKLRALETELQGDQDVVDVKFFPGSSSEIRPETLACDALTLLQGGELAEDVTNEEL